MSENPKTNIMVIGEGWREVDLIPETQTLPDGDYGDMIVKDGIVYATLPNGEVITISATQTKYRYDLPTPDEE
jgi:hypothetical protein